MGGFVVYIGLSQRRLPRLPLPLKNYCNATCRDEVSLVSVSGSSLRGARFGSALLPCSGTSVIRISDDELVTNTYIKEDKASEYIMFKGEDEKKEEKLYLEDRPIAFNERFCAGEQSVIERRGRIRSVGNSWSSFPGGRIRDAQREAS